MKESQARYACLNLMLPELPEAGDSCWEKASPIELCDVQSGRRPFLHTEFRLLRDDSAQAFYLKITAEDDEIRSTFRMHDETLYKQDVFELFLADGGTLRQYKEIEVSPFDVSFTGTITFRSETQRQLNMDWDIPGFITKTRFSRQENQTLSLWKLPYAAFDQKPTPGNAWRFNVFRVDHSRRGEELQAWQMTGARNFHVPERFGWLDFIA